MSVSMDVQQSQESIPTAHYDAVAVGAGPYGLSTAAHLLDQEFKIASFGKPV